MDSPVMHMISDILSSATILSCLFLKVPQIMHIREKQSAEGINVHAMLMEITGYSIVTLYNYTNSYGVLTYLEYPVILLQLYVLLALTLRYRGGLSAALPTAAAAGGYVLLCGGFAARILPAALLSYLLPLCTPLSGAAKVTYLYGIIRAGSAENVSRTTWLISVATNLARVLTVCVDSGDGALVSNFVVSAALSLSVLLTAIYYQRHPRSAAAKSE